MTRFDDGDMEATEVDGPVVDDEFAEFLAKELKRASGHVERLQIELRRWKRMAAAAEVALERLRADEAQKMPSASEDWS